MCFFYLSVKEVGNLKFLTDEMVMKIALVLSWHTRTHRVSCQPCYFWASSLPSASSCCLALPDMKYQAGPTLSPPIPPLPALCSRPLCFRNPRLRLLSAAWVTRVLDGSSLLRGKRISCCSSATLGIWSQSSEVLPSL